MENKKDNKNDDEEDYIGNMWGWKFSFLGLFLMIIFTTLFAYRVNKYGLESVFNKDTPSVFEDKKTYHHHNRDTTKH